MATTEYSLFMKGNAVPPSNVKYAASERFLNKEGKPEEWEVCTIDATLNESLREQNSSLMATGKKGISIPRTNQKEYLADFAATCTVYPNLNDKALQDSYGVMGAKTLLRAMLTSGEYDAYLDVVQEANGYDLSFEDKAEKVKN